VSGQGTINLHTKPEPYHTYQDFELCTSDFCTDVWLNPVAGAVSGAK
jgi:hypothetical protein